MNQIVLKGILKKNTRGRCYLVYPDGSGNRKLVRLEPAPCYPSGQLVSLTGFMEERSFQVIKAQSRYLPRRKRSKYYFTKRAG